MQVLSFVNDCGDEDRLVLKIRSLADIVTYPSWVKCKLQLQAKFGLFYCGDHLLAYFSADWKQYESKF